jgi:hypothetical protein
MVLLMLGTTTFLKNKLSLRSFLEPKVLILLSFTVLKKYNNNLENFKQEIKFMHKIRKNATYVVRYLNLL